MWIAVFCSIVSSNYSCPFVLSFFVIETTFFLIFFDNLSSFFYPAAIEGGLGDYASLIERDSRGELPLLVVTVRDLDSQLLSDIGSTSAVANASSSTVREVFEGDSRTGLALAISDGQIIELIDPLLCVILVPNGVSIPLGNLFEHGLVGVVADGEAAGESYAIFQCASEVAVNVLESHLRLSSIGGVQSRSALGR